MFTKNLKKKKNNALMSNQQLLRIGSESKKNTYQRQIYRRYSVNVPAWNEWRRHANDSVSGRDKSFAVRRTVELRLVIRVSKFYKLFSVVVVLFSSCFQRKLIAFEF